MYQGKFYSDDGFGLLDDEDLKLSTKLLKKTENQKQLTKKEQDQVEYLRRKKQGLKNPELNPNIKSFEDIKSDYKYASEYEFTKADKEKINNALDIVSANRQKRRTKQQWLDVANMIGSQSTKLDSESLKNLAFGSWTELAPNQKDNLNRQGTKYVPFSIDEWVKAVYKGAGVGEKIKENTVQTTQTETKQEKTQTNETKPKVETKKVTKMDIQYGDHKDPRIIVGRQASTAYNKTLDQYKMQVEYLTKDAKQAIEDYGGIEKLWKDSQTMSQVEIANNFGKANETTQETANNQQESTQDSTFNNEQKQKAKENIKSITKKINNFVSENGITEGDNIGLTNEKGKEYFELMKEYSDAIFDYETKRLKEISESNIKDDRKTSLEKQIYVQARKDLLNNKNIYDAIEIAAHGVSKNADTIIDDIMNGKNKDISPKQLYDEFSETRKKLHEKYGDKITLYRVEGMQKAKATKNYGSSIEYTKQYGDDVKKYDIDIDDIVAINTNRTGTYEDIIVAQGGIDKYINKNENNNVETNQNENIPATKSENVISAKIDDNKTIELKKSKDNTYIKEIKQPKDNKSVIPKEVMENQIAHLEDGTKLSNFYSNITEKSKFITEENAQKLSQEEIWKYAPQTNKETMQKAMDEIGNTQKSLEAAYGKFLSKENFDPEDVAMGWIFLKRFQDAGNYDAMVQVAKKMRNTGATKAGRTVQMFNLQSRLTPEGMLYYAQSELMEAEQKYNEGKSLKQIQEHANDFTLTEKETKYIKEQMQKIQGMEDGRAKDIELAKINKMLSEKLPHEKGEALRAWMRLAMLGNFKTQVRNIGGNAMITPVNALADVPAAMVDRAIAKKTGVRTVGAPSIKGTKAYAKGFVKGGQEAIQDYKMGIDTKNVDISRFDISQKNPFNDQHKGIAKPLNILSKTGNKANQILDLAMSGGDRVFYQGAFESSLQNQMRLNNVETPTQDMIDIATQEALSRTWNDNNDYTNFVLNTRRALNKFSKNGLGTGYGLGDVLIPFAKTPANLTKAIVDYSPVGLANSIFKTKKIKNAIETGQITPQIQHEFAQNVGKGVAGTVLYGIAYALAKAGIASGSSDDDKDVANFIKNTMGIQPYSITINSKSFTYDWAQPIAAPLAIVTDANKNLSSKSNQNTETRILNTILDVSNTGFNVLMQQSFLSGMAEVFNNQEGIVNGIMEEVLSLPARAVPTLFKQINDMFDATQRTAYEHNSPFTTSKQNAMAKTPASKKLAPQVDTLGREVQKYGGDKNKVTYGLKSFLSPANRSNERTSEVANEIYRLYQSTGDKNIMPKVAPYYIDNKTTGRIELSSHDRADYQKTSGKIVSSALIDLLADPKYQTLSDEKQAQIVNKIVNYADAKAKQKYTKQLSYYYAPADKKVQSGMPIADYYLSKVK